MLPVTFVERQAENRRRTLLLFGGFAILLAGLGLGLDSAVFGLGLPDGPAWPYATIGALGFAAGMSTLSYFSGAAFVLGSLHAQPLRPENDEHKQLENIVGEMAIAAGIPRPSVYVIDDQSPNALATGRDPEHASIAVTEGALKLLDREETQGVIAHEIAHIANRDTLVMTAAGVLLGSIVLLSDWGRRTVFYSRTERRRGGLWLIPLLLVLALLAPIVSRVLAMAVSRQREYLADASAAEFTRNPMALARALETIGASVSPLRNATQGTAHLFISDPLKRRVDDREGRLADLLSTHPPLQRRIAILRAMASGTHA